MWRDNAQSFAACKYQYITRFLGMTKNRQALPSRFFLSFSVFVSLFVILSLSFYPYSSHSPSTFLLLPSSVSLPLILSFVSVTLTPFSPSLSSITYLSISLFPISFLSQLPTPPLIFPSFPYSFSTLFLPYLSSFSTSLSSFLLILTHILLLPLPLSLPYTLTASSFSSFTTRVVPRPSPESHSDDRWRRARASSSILIHPRSNSIYFQYIGTLSLSPFLSTLSLHSLPSPYPSSLSPHLNPLHPSFRPPPHIHHSISLPLFPPRICSTLFLFSSSPPTPSLYLLPPLLSPSSPRFTHPLYPLLLLPPSLFLLLFFRFSSPPPKKPFTSISRSPISPSPPTTAISLHFSSFPPFPHPSHLPLSLSPSPPTSRSHLSSSLPPFPHQSLYLALLSLFLPSSHRGPSVARKTAAEEN
ncbi:hypothetical protein C7M84_019316 [Penaeus vannamei]|uniref:Uncharacterized protein n=1 Tax=Penaeus vannamei TaxID=6689 RepID=A0A423SF58_PENVA|nr:hypothetical protein C7M84_019316 [Penaeus vannamei]